jgi:putative DNA primase/helicase
MTHKRNSPREEPIKEWDIVLALIVDDNYVKQIRGLWRDDYVQAEELRIAARWCLHYFAKYKRVPGSDISALYMDELLYLPTAQAELIERTLARISENYNIAEGKWNTAYYLDRTVAYFEKRDLEDHTFALQGLLESGEIDRAKALHRDYKPPVYKGHARRADEIEPLPVLWLWDGVVARSELTLLVGPPFIGKSQTAMSIAATTSSGGCWPATDRQARPRDVLMMSAEDADNKVLVPRLIAAGADLTRCHILDRADDMLQAVQWFEESLDGLSQQGKHSDPATAFFKQGEDPNNIAHVRRVLRPLVELAWRRHVTMLVIHHTTKAMEGGALAAVSGSIGWSAAARVVNLVLPDPEREGRGLLGIVGSNLGAKHAGYAYQIVPETIGNGRIKTSRAVWESEVINMTAEQILAKWRSAKSQHKITEATDWLKDLLGNGPMSVGDIEKAGQQAGQAWSTIQRAAANMGIEKSRQGGRNGRWIWGLPGRN